MNPTGSYFVPSVILAVFIHALVVAVLAVNWNSKPNIEVARVQPYYISAELVARNPYTVKEEQEKQAAARAQARREQIAAQQRQQEQAAELREKQRREELAKQRAAAEDQAQLVNNAAAEEKKDDAAAARQNKIKEEERLEMEKSLSLAVTHEQDARQAVTDDEKAMAYVAQIKRVIIQNWSRPPSARNGMQVLLKVHLVPTGEVVDVSVVKSSGNEAFDRSAVLAVRKSERFDVPSDSREFERNFREFEVLFRPEDLRL